MKRTMRLLARVLALLPGLALAESPLKLQIVQRPPYLMMKPNGEVSGIAVEPTMAAIQKSGIAVEWEEVPALRQLQRLKLNKERVCSVGWYKTEEREKFAKFTHPVSQDSPWAGFANIAFNPPGGATVSAVLGDSEVVLLLKNGYVYGNYLDEKISVMRAKRMETSGDMPQLFKMIEIGRAHITFAPIEEIQYYLNKHLVSATSTKVITFSEMPMGYKRHLMCSKLVEDEVINKFNDALSIRKPALAR